MDVIKRLKTLTQDRHWSQYRLAKEADLPQTTIANIFSRGTIPSVFTLDRLCRAFDISLSEFFAEEAADNDDPEERELNRNWRTLSPRQQEIVLELLKHMNDNM